MKYPEAKCQGCPFLRQRDAGIEGDLETCKYFLVGEAPARQEVAKGRPFVGVTGRLLEQFLARVGIKREECYITNAVKCQIPPGDKAVANTALMYCRNALLDELARVNTGATIALMGTLARDALFPGTGSGILAWTGWHEWEGRDIYVMVHPAYYNYHPLHALNLLTDLQRVARGRLVPPVVTPCVLTSVTELEEFVASLHRRPVSKRGYIAYDLETDQVDHMRDRILCMSVSVDYGTAHIIPDYLLYDDGVEWVTTNWTKAKRAAFLGSFRYENGLWWKPNPEVVALLREMFAVPGYKWVGHNAKFDMRFLTHLGVANVHCDFDTIVAHYALDERTPGPEHMGGHSLKHLADVYFDVGDYEHDLFNYIAKKAGRYSKIPREVLYRYNAMDTEVTLRLAHVFEDELKQLGLYEQPFLFPLMAAVPMLLQMELDGIAIDWNEVDRVELDEIQPELDLVAENLRRISGRPDLNPQSSKVINNILYDELGFPIIEVRTRAAGRRLKARSSQVAVIDGWAKLWEQGLMPVTEEAWEFALQVRYYRHVAKMRNSYIKKWRLFEGTDGRVHPSYWLRGTVTGRLSAKDPPVQTIPSKVKDKWAPLIGNIHVAGPGCLLVYADYSQAEIRIAAYLSQDPFMIESLVRGDDYHSEVAVAAFGKDYSSDERTACKRLTFGWMYGGNAYEIAMNALQFEGPVARHFAEKWDRLFSRMVEWRKEQGDLMLRQGYVETVLGRRRRQLLITRESVGKAKRVAANAPIQSPASDMTLISAMIMHERHKHDDEVRVILLIHDSVILEVAEARAPVVAEELGQTMVEVASGYFPGIPFVADAKIAKRLGELL